MGNCSVGPSGRSHIVAFGYCRTFFNSKLDLRTSLFDSCTPSKKIPSSIYLSYRGRKGDEEANVYRGLSLAARSNAAMSNHIYRI